MKVALALVHLMAVKSDQHQDFNKKLVKVITCDSCHIFQVFLGYTNGFGKNKIII